MTLLGLVEETLRGRDQRLVQLCDVPGIVNALEGFGIFDLEMLADNLEMSSPALQLALGGTAPPSFLALLKAQLGKRQKKA